MREPDLVRVLQQQTEAMVGLIRSRDYAGGAGSVAARVAELKRRSVRYAICDATSEADLQVLAEATVDWPLMTGGSSVAVYYPALWRARGEMAEADTRSLPNVTRRGGGSRRKLRGTHGRTDPGVRAASSGAARCGRRHRQRSRDGAARAGLVAGEACRRVP